MSLLIKMVKPFQLENLTFKATIMKNVLFLLFASICLFTSCSKSYTCACSESYSGANESYSNETTSEIDGLKKGEAEEKCAEGNTGPQTLLGETWGVSCELK